jgi:hypothetical protein
VEQFSAQAADERTEFWRITCGGILRVVFYESDSYTFYNPLQMPRAQYVSHLQRTGSSLIQQQLLHVVCPLAASASASAAANALFFSRRS